MSNATWVLSIIAILLVALDAMYWYYAVGKVGDPSLFIGFLLRHVFNK